jgi:deoxyribodipyrimidine photo-lyase
MFMVLLPGRKRALYRLRYRRRLSENTGSTSVSGTIVWLRKDLRLGDHPALDAALQRREPVIPVYILSESEEGEWPLGGAARWWLNQSLDELDADLRRRGSRLVLARGPALETLQKLIAQTGATAVHWNGRYEPAAIARDMRIKDALRGAGVGVASFNGTLLREPWDVQNREGRPYRVFTPFKRHVLEHLAPARPLPAPRRLAAPARWPAALRLEDLELLPALHWYETMEHTWRPGEAGAVASVRRFVSRSLRDYGVRRDQPGVDGTSRLSPHLHFGELSARRLWHALVSAARRHRMSIAKLRESTFVSELMWREFAYHLLYHFPATPLEPLDRRFGRFPWRNDAARLHAWQQGRTGFPIVDAGMRQLWASGWMHNRVRMIVASLLVKNLQVHWIEGARWFWDTLVDADLAANTLNWQWVAGCGAAAAPYFRIFNPIAQGQRFDPAGDYVRRWVPELARLPAQHIHAPWLAPQAVLDAAGVRIGRDYADYPEPIVDLAQSRADALAAYRKL